MHHINAFRSLYLHVCPLGGKLEGFTVPFFAIVTHFRVGRYDQVPSHLSRYIALSGIVRSGRSFIVSVTGPQVQDIY
jgi:hypothetical protein